MRRAWLVVLLLGVACDGSFLNWDEYNKPNTTDACCADPAKPRRYECQVEMEISKGAFVPVDIVGCFADVDDATVEAPHLAEEQHAGVPGLAGCQIAVCPGSGTGGSGTAADGGA